MEGMRRYGETLDSVGRGGWVHASPVRWLTLVVGCPGFPLPAGFWFFGAGAGFPYAPTTLRELSLIKPGSICSVIMTAASSAGLRCEPIATPVSRREGVRPIGILGLRMVHIMMHCCVAHDTPSLPPRARAPNLHPVIVGCAVHHVPP